MLSPPENRVFQVGTAEVAAHGHQKYPRRIRNIRERAVARDRGRMYACVYAYVKRGTHAYAHTPIRKCVSGWLERQSKARHSERTSACMSTQSQGSLSADIWPCGPSPEGSRDKEDLPLFLGALGWIISWSLARTHTTVYLVPE